MQMANWSLRIWDFIWSDIFICKWTLWGHRGWNRPTPALKSPPQLIPFQQDTSSLSLQCIEQQNASWPETLYILRVTSTSISPKNGVWKTQKTNVCGFCELIIQGMRPQGGGGETEKEWSYRVLGDLEEKRKKGEECGVNVKGRGWEGERDKQEARRAPNAWTREVSRKMEGGGRRGESSWKKGTPRRKLSQA